MVRIPGWPKKLESSDNRGDLGEYTGIGQPEWMRQLVGLKAGYDDGSHIALEKLYATADILADAVESIISVDEIIDLVCRFYGLSDKKSLLGTSEGNITAPGLVARGLAREFTAINDRNLSIIFNDENIYFIRRSWAELKKPENKAINEERLVIRKRIIENYEALQYDEHDNILFQVNNQFHVNRYDLLEAIAFIQRRIIEKNRDGKIYQTTQDPRLALLDKFAADNPGMPVSKYLLYVFPELLGNQNEAKYFKRPKQAPAYWAANKVAGDTPPAFIKRHYAPWLGKGLARPDIKALDPSLYVALANWLRNNDMPEDIDLPTLKEKNDRWVSSIEANGRPNMGELSAREASHIRNLVSRRKRPPER